MYQYNRVLRACALLLATLGVCCFSVATCGAEPAEEALLGTWQGDLVINPSTRVKVQFIVRRDAANKYSAVLNAPGDSSLRDIPVTTFSASGDGVVFVVNEVSGRYEGTLRDRKITGKWQQSGSSFDLSLAPYAKARIPDSVAAHLSGPWHGVLSFPDTRIPVVVNFKADPNAASGVSATIDSPNQGAFGIPAEEVSLEDGELSVNALQPKMGLSGRIQGNDIVGKWIQGGSAPLTLTKGQYLAGGLAVAEPVRRALKGDWYGEVNGGIGIAFRFQEEPDGKLSAFLDSPYEGRRGIRLDRVSVAGDRISLGAPAVGITFDGTLAPDAISGKFVAGQTKGRDVTLKRGEYVQETFHIAPNLSGPLLGKWEGRTANNTDIVLRFQRNDRGDLLATEDVPSRQLFSMPVTQLGFDGQSLKLMVRGISAEFKGKLAGNEMSGDWTLPGMQFPLKLVRAER
ncbi:MAG TPA: hypothetical protein VI653_27890 [Steroidobacteraceae bacterium]